jgi:drug/metabolite transporter superfamily protein YnfA
MKKFFVEIRKLLQPPQWASWQTLIFLSIFSTIMAGVTTTITQIIISAFGWLFLVLGVWWFTYQEDVKKTWITGAVICLALYGGWRNFPQPAMFISWPPVSALISAIPKFVKSDPDRRTPIFVLPKGDVWQDLVLMFLLNVILSCWFQFYYVLQGWLDAYPSLLADNFSHSAFVYDGRPNQPRISKGTLLLTQVEAALKEQLDGRPWPEVERWLIDLNQQLPDLETSARQQMPFAENVWWNLQGKVLSDAYDVQFQAIWQGPSSSNGYTITTVCRITQGFKPEAPPEFKFDSPAPPAKATVRPRSTLATVKCKPPTQQPMERLPGVGV